MKIDAALSSVLSSVEETQRSPREAVDVSVRARAPLTSIQVDELRSLGVSTADTRRTIFTARIPLEQVGAIAAKPWIFRVALAQELQAKT